MLIDHSVFGVHKCVLQRFMGVDPLTPWKVEGQKFRGTTCRLIYQGDNRSVLWLCKLEYNLSKGLEVA